VVFAALSVLRATWTGAGGGLAAGADGVSGTDGSFFATAAGGGGDSSIVGGAPPGELTRARGGATTDDE
jgi:hypothetical protein